MSKQLVDINSKPAFLTQLAVFGTPPTALEIDRMKSVTYLPLSSLKGARTFEFLANSTDDWIDISRSQVDFWMRIVDKDGNPIIDPLAPVAPINGIGMTAIQKVELFIGDVLVESTSILNAESDYLQIIAGYDREPVKTQFVPQIFFPDQYGQMDTLNIVGTEMPQQTQPAPSSSSSSSSAGSSGGGTSSGGQQPAASGSGGSSGQTQSGTNPSSSSSGSSGSSGSGGSGSSDQTAQQQQQQQQQQQDPPGADTDKKKEKKLHTYENSNGNWSHRRDLFALSRIIHTSAPLMTALTNQMRFLPGRLTLRFRFTRHENDYCLMYPESKKAEVGGYQLEIMRAELKLYKAVLEPNKLLSMEMYMRKSDCKIPLQRIQMAYHLIPGGVSDYSFPNLCLGTLPVRAMYAFVTNKAFSGKCHLNPFNFANFNLRSMSVSINGEQVIDSPILLNFPEKDFIDGYNSFLKGLGLRRRNVSRIVSMANFPEGYAIYAMDYSNDLRSSSGVVYAPVNTGVLKMDLKWQNPLDDPIIMICQFFYDSQLTIHSDRSLVFDYTA
jgi:hypothetical protein